MSCSPSASWIARAREGVAGGNHDRLSDAEVGDVGLVSLQQDVLRLDVPVHHIVAVREREGLADLARDGERVGQRQLVLPQQPLAESLALDEGHDEVERVRGLAGVVERQDVRMGEAARDGDLAQEALRAERLRQLGAEDLQRDRTVVSPVVGEVHRRPSAAPELALDRVPVREGRLQSREPIRCYHRRSRGGAFKDMGPSGERPEARRPAGGSGRVAMLVRS